MSSGTGWAKEFEISDDTLLFGLINAAPPSFGSLMSVIETNDLYAINILKQRNMAGQSIAGTRL